MSHVLHRTNNILQYKTHFWKAIAIKVYTKSLNQHRFAVQLCTPWDFKTFQKYNIDKALSCFSYDIIISSFLMKFFSILSKKSWEKQVIGLIMHSNDWEHLINRYFFKLWIVWIWKIYYLFKNIPTMQCGFILHNATSCRWKGC